MAEYIFRIDGALYNEETGEAVMKPEVVGELIRCKDCKWFNEPGCSIQIVDDSDKPSEEDYCSFAELRGEQDEKGRT